MSAPKQQTPGDASDYSPQSPSHGPDHAKVMAFSNPKALIASDGAIDAELLSYSLSPATAEMVDAAAKDVSEFLDKEPSLGRRMYGKPAFQRRNVKFFKKRGGRAHGYRYSGRLQPPCATTPDSLQALIEAVEAAFPPPFGKEVGVLVNEYNEKHYISQHSDDERGIHPGWVLTVSSGGRRNFVVKRKSTKATVASADTSLHRALLMRGEDFQSTYTHGVAKKIGVPRRTSFSFRYHETRIDPMGPMGPTKPPAN